MYLKGQIVRKELNKMKRMATHLNFDALQNIK